MGGLGKGNISSPFPLHAKISKDKPLDYLRIVKKDECLAKVAISDLSEAMRRLFSGGSLDLGRVRTRAWRRQIVVGIVNSFSP